MSSEQLAGGAPALSSILRRAGEAMMAFGLNLREPSSAVALGSCLFILAAAGVVMTTKSGIRAYPPPPPTALEIRNAEAISGTFSAAPPTQARQPDR